MGRGPIQTLFLSRHIVTPNCRFSKRFHSCFLCYSSINRRCSDILYLLGIVLVDNNFLNGQLSETAFLSQEITNFVFSNFSGQTAAKPKKLNVTASLSTLGTLIF